MWSSSPRALRGCEPPRAMAGAAARGADRHLDRDGVVAGVADADQTRARRAGQCRWRPSCFRHAGDKLPKGVVGVHACPGSLATAQLHLTGTGGNGGGGAGGAGGEGAGPR